jgi:hypothetical protein
MPIRAEHGEGRPAYAGTFARIHVGDASAAAALVQALGAARCFAVRRGPHVVDVLTPRSGGGEEQARVELGFFLKAWAADHPAASPRVDW